MSGHFPSVACEGCDQTIYQTENTGYWFWRDDDNRACLMRHHIGYCRACAALSFVGLPPADHDTRGQRWAFGMLKEPVSIVRHEWPDFPALTYDPGLRFRLRRRHRGLCLICGAPDVVAIRIPRRFPFRGAARWDTGQRHDGCGGRIVIQGADYVRSRPEWEWRVFGMEGQLVYGAPLRRPTEPYPYVEMTIKELLAASTAHSEVAPPT